MNFNWRIDCYDVVIVQRAVFENLAIVRRIQAELKPLTLPDHTTSKSYAAVLLCDLLGICCGSSKEFTGRDYLCTLRMVQGCIAAPERNTSADVEGSKM